MTQEPLTIEAALKMTKKDQLHTMMHLYHEASVKEIEAARLKADAQLLSSLLSAS